MLVVYHGEVLPLPTGGRHLCHCASRAMRYVALPTGDSASWSVAAHESEEGKEQCVAWSLSQSHSRVLWATCGRLRVCGEEGVAGRGSEWGGRPVSCASSESWHLRVTRRIGVMTGGTGTQGARVHG
jgi:hypothetical protein